MNIVAYPDDSLLLLRDEGVTQIIAVGAQGPAGADGSSSDTPTVSYVASISLGGHRVVVLDSTPEALYADNQIDAHGDKILGITTGAASQGATTTVQISGQMIESSWAWTPGLPLWLITAGQISHIAPTTGFLAKIGFAITATKIMIEIEDPIYR